MVGNPYHGSLYYRCAASRDFARQPQVSRPPANYLREDAIIRQSTSFLRDELTGRHLNDNLRRVAEAHYRAALGAYGDAGGDPALIAGWIAETTAIKNRSSQVWAHRGTAAAHDRQPTRHHRRGVRRPAGPGRSPYFPLS
jgi:hypothetical protein